MLRQVSRQAAATAPRFVVPTTVFRPSPLNASRYLTTESVATTQASPPPSLQAQTAKSKTTTTQVPAVSAPRQLTYLVERTASNNVSVYNDTRSGGTRKETTIKKIVGNAHHLKRDLIDELKFKKDDVNVNPVTGHVKIKVRQDRLALGRNLFSKVKNSANVL